MFFRRLSKALSERTKPTKAKQDNHRRHYRQRELAGKSVEFLVCTRTGLVFEGEFIDASVKGISALFTLAKDPGLQIGDTVEVFVSAEQEETHVRTPARVVYVEKGGDQHWRYAFEFTSIGNLYSQLDEFYSRIFNRREYRRVSIPPEQAVRAKVLWDEQALNCRVHDISIGGMSTVLPAEKASLLDSVRRLGLEISLPKTKQVLNGFGFIRSRTALAGRTLFGIQFDLTDGMGSARNQEHLERYVAERHALIKRWERSTRSA